MIFSLNVALHEFTLYPGWFKEGSAVNMPYSDDCFNDAQNKGGAETGIIGYQYNYLSDNFKVIVKNSSLPAKKIVPTWK
jgi:hypothetical protein